jgi:ribonucleoside-diphosphate reductase alpha subunit
MSQSITREEMYVTKRNGKIEIVSFDKILNRIKKLCEELGIKINYTLLSIKIIDQLYDKISTTKIDELTSEQCATMTSIHPDYNVLAGRIIVSNHQKNTKESFSETMRILYQFKDKNGKQSPLVSEELFNIVKKNSSFFNKLCDYSRDFLIDYFGFKTLERAYLLKINNKPVERPQHLWLRVSIGLHGDNLEKIKETYDAMSQKYFTHATPTLFNSGTPHPQLSSCFLLAMESDSICGIYNTLKDCALISKWAGGIGIHIHNIRASGSHIRGTNGSSNGIVPMLKVFNNTSKYVDQCLTPDTILYTTKGPISICEAISGTTEIFNRTGQTETIQTVLEHAYSGKMLEIFNESSSLKITPEHPVYVLSNYMEETDKTIQNDLELGLAKFEWREAKEVSEKDYLVYSIPQWEKDDSSLTEEICYIYGLIFSGLINNMIYDPNYNKYSEKYEIMHLMADVNKIIKFLDDRNIAYEFTTKEYMNKLSWKKTVNLPFIHSDFFRHGEIILSERWLFLPPAKIEKILSGVGNINYNYYNSKNTLVNSNDTRAFEKPLLINEYFFFMNLKLGRIYNGVKRDQKIISKRYANYLLVPVHRIQEYEYTGVLYDLQMEKEHNYLLKTGIVHNGGGKRNGSFAIYLEPWHADIELFLQMRKNHGDEELKARDLFYALWMCDLFMKRIKAGEKWTLMCPDECPGLSDVYGDEFETLYTQYESEGKGRRTINARELWFQILDAQMETGTPYLVYKDSTNKKSNQKNVGVIKSSNLCSEITLYSDEKETAVCNLASIALPSFINHSTSPPTFDYDKLHEMTRLITYNLNQVIDRNYYPTEKSKVSNMRHRPIGIGVQGLADTFIQLDVAFHSEDAKIINKNIFETIYHAALEESVSLAIRDGAYETFKGSPASQGILQFDFWDTDPGQSRYDWDKMKRDVQEKGLRNSMLLSPMPTASTSQILGFNECIEPITSNIYSRRTIAGEFIVANKYLMRDLIKLDLWNEKIKNNIIANQGSIQHIEIIPQHLKDKYKTVWEIPMKHLIDMAADRGSFICQSQSLNLWIEEPNYNNLTSMHFYAWNKGLKTGIYYLRRRGRHQAQQFTIEPEKRVNTGEIQQEDEICEACGA